MLMAENEKSGNGGQRAWLGTLLSYSGRCKGRMAGSLLASVLSVAAGVRALLCGVSDHGDSHGGTARLRGRAVLALPGRGVLRCEQSAVRSLDASLPRVRLHHLGDATPGLRRQADEGVARHRAGKKHRSDKERLPRQDRGGRGPARPYDPRALRVGAPRPGARGVARGHLGGHRRPWEPPSPAPRPSPLSHGVRRRRRHARYNRERELDQRRRPWTSRA